MAELGEILLTPLVKDPHFMVAHKAIDELWTKYTKMNSYDSITNQMMMVEAYELALGIQTQESNSPITLATINRSTNFMENTLLERTINKIIQMKMCSATGMTVIEILNLPTFEVMMYYRSLRTMAAADNKLLNEVEEKLK